MKPIWKCLLVGVVAAVVVWAAVPQADAQCWCYGPTAWGRCYSPYCCGYASCCSCCTSCCSPCCTSCCTSSCCDGCCGWYLGCRPGPIRRLLLGPCRWYWGGGCCYSSCCSVCSCDPCCCVSDDCCTDDAAAPSPSPTPAKKPDDAMPDAPAPAEPSADATSADESGFLTIWVPYDAKVTVNGLETKSTGSKRQFVSFGLKPGFSYKYVVKAQVIRDGQVEEDSRTVILTAGQISSVAFGFNVPSQQLASAQ